MADDMNYYLDASPEEDGVVSTDIGAYKPKNYQGLGHYRLGRGESGAYTNPMIKSNVGQYVDELNKYDKRLAHINDVVSGEKTMDNVRGETQTGFEKIANGVLKGAVLTGTTFIDSVLGLPVGLINLMTGGEDGKTQFSDLWNNPLTNYLQKANEWSEKVLPNYYSKEEQEKKWYQNVFSANFIGDKLLKNVGFFVGAALGGKVNAGLLSKVSGINKTRDAFKAAVFEGSGLEEATASQIYNNAVKGKYIFKPAALADDLAASAKQVSNHSNILKMAGALSAGMGEARIQTVGNINQAREEFKEQLRHELDLYADEARKNMPAEYKTLVQDAEGNMTIGLTPEGEELLKQQIEEKKNKGIEGIEKTLAKIGNVDFAFNTAVLTVSDWMQFGRYYAGGYKNARKSSAAAIKAAEGYVKKKSRLKDALNIIKSPIVEGNEEMMQEVSGVTSKNMYKQDSWLKAAENPNAIQQTNGFIKSLAKGMVDIYGDVDQWENFAIGGIIGFGAIPTMKTSDSGKKTIGFSGGIWDNLSEIRDNNRKNETLTNALNRIVEDERTSNYMRNLVINNKYEDDKSLALSNNDEFEYKNADISQLISNVITFDQAGRLEDLKEMNEGFANISTPEEVEDIRSKTIDKETGKSIYDGMSDEQIIESVKKQADKVNRIIDAYADISSNLQTITGKDSNSEELQELTWQALKIDDWEHRFKTLWGEVQEEFKELAPVIGEKTVEVDGKEVPIMEIAMASPAEMLLYSPAYVAAAHVLQESSGKTVKEEIEKQEKLKSKTRSKRKLKVINEALEELKKGYDMTQSDAAKSAQLLNKISDLGQILSARHSFLDNYRKYLTEPETLTQHVERVKKEGEEAQQEFNKKEQAKRNEDVKAQLREVKNLKEFRNILGAHKEEGLGDIENSINQVAIADELSKEDHPIAMQYMDIRNTYHSLVETLNEDMATLENAQGVREFTDEQIQHARRVLELMVEEANNAADLKDGESALLKNLQSPFDPDTYSNELSNDEMLIAKGIVKRVINSVYQTNKRHETISQPLTPTPETKQTVEEDPTKKEKKDKKKEDGLNDPSTPDGIMTSNKLDTRATDASKEIEIPLEDKNKGVKHSYWKPAVSEHDLDVMDKEGRVVPLHTNKKFAGLKPILEVLSEKNSKTNESAFSYVNKGKLKPGAQITFKIDPKITNKAEMQGNPLLIYDGDQLIGVMPEQNASWHEGLAEALKVIQKEYETFASKPENADKVFTSKLTTQVSRILPGRLVFGSQENEVSELFKNAEIPTFSFIKQGLFNTPNVSEQEEARHLGLRDLDTAVEGRLYMGIPAGDGKRYPVAVRVKHFNKREFDLNDVNNQGFPVYQAIKKGIEQIVEGIETGNNDLKIAGINALEANLFLKGDLYVEGTTLKTGATGININLKEGKGDDAVEKFHIFAHTGNAGSKGSTLMSWGADGNERNVNQPASKVDRAEVVQDILNQLQEQDLRFQVTGSQLNTTNYNEELVKSGKITTNLSHPGVASAWFQMYPLDAQGKMIKAPAKTSSSPSKKPPINVENAAVLTYSLDGYKGLVDYKQSKTNNPNAGTDADIRPLGVTTSNISYESPEYIEEVRKKFNGDKPFTYTIKVKGQKYLVATAGLNASHEKSQDGRTGNVYASIKYSENLTVEDEKKLLQLAINKYNEMFSEKFGVTHKYEDSQLSEIKKSATSQSSYSQANNPVNAKETIAKNITTVTYRGKQYQVDDRGNFITDVPLIFREIISDLAWIKNNQGTGKVSNIEDYYRLEKSPTDIKYINRKTLEYAGIPDAAKIEKKYKEQNKEKKESEGIDMDMAKKVAMGAGLAVNPDFVPKTETKPTKSKTDDLLSFKYMMENHKNFMDKKGFTEETWNKLSKEDQQHQKDCASI